MKNEFDRRNVKISGLCAGPVEYHRRWSRRDNATVRTLLIIGPGRKTKRMRLFPMTTGKLPPRSRGNNLLRLGGHRNGKVRSKELK